MLEVMINAGQRIKKGDEVNPFISYAIPFTIAIPSILLFITCVYV